MPQKLLVRRVAVLGAGVMGASLRQGMRSVFMDVCGVRRGNRDLRRSYGRLKKYILRHDDACETTLNPGFKWEELGAIGLPAARRTCTPGFRSLPVVVIKGQGECFACCRPRQRMRVQYSETCLNTEAVRRF